MNIPNSLWLASVQVWSLVEANDHAGQVKHLRIGSWAMPIPYRESAGKPLSPRIQRYNFYFDLAGDVEKDGILTAGPWDYKKPEKEWKILANSFSAWLVKISEIGSPIIENS